MAKLSAPTVVLVHGGFVDGAGWEGVYNILKKDGHNVSIVQNPTTSLADDVAATRLAIARAQGPVVLVGHSYGGVVVSEAGSDPKVAGLVYIAAFVPDKGESVESLDQESASRSTGSADPTAGERLSVPRQGKVPRVICGRRRRSEGCVPGRLPGPVGPWRSLRCGQRACLEEQAELVLGRDRGQDDPAAGPAPDGNARKRDCRGSCRQPRDLYIEAGGRGGSHCQGGEEHELGNGSVSLEWQSAQAAAVRRRPRVGAGGVSTIDLAMCELHSARTSDATATRYCWRLAGFFAVAGFFSFLSPISSNPT